MKILALYNVYNEDEYFDYSLKSIYDHVDSIFVYEGCFKETYDACECNIQSTDNTLNILDMFNDHQKKMFIISGGKPLPQLQQRSVIFDYIKTDEPYWLWLIDGDEVYSEENIAKIKKYLSVYSLADSLRINSYVFINDFMHYVDIKMPRLFKIHPGWNHKFVEPNKIIQQNRHSINELGEEERDDIFFHHYSYCKNPERFLMKRKERIKQTGHFKWYLNKDNKITADGVNIKIYNGEHPAIMNKHPRTLV